jgi:hypothetical protein
MTYEHILDVVGWVHAGLLAREHERMELARDCTAALGACATDRQIEAIGSFGQPRITKRVRIHRLFADEGRFLPRGSRRATRWRRLDLVRRFETLG